MKTNRLQQYYIIGLFAGFIHTASYWTALDEEKEVLNKRNSSSRQKEKKGGRASTERGRSRERRGQTNQTIITTRRTAGTKSRRTWGGRLSNEGCK